MGGRRRKEMLLSRGLHFRAATERILVPFLKVLQNAELISLAGGRGEAGRKRERFVSNGL